MAMFLPSNTTLLVQPMNQRVIVACKMLYQSRYRDEVLEDEDLERDTRGLYTLENIKKNNW